MSGPKSISELMSQASKVVAILRQVRTRVEAMEVVGESAAGMVKVTLRGNGRIQKVEIAPTVTSEHSEAVEDLVATAMNKAQERLDEQTKEAAAEFLPADVGSIFFRLMR